LPWTDVQRRRKRAPGEHIGGVCVEPNRAGSSASGRHRRSAAPGLRERACRFGGLAAGSYSIRFVPWSGRRHRHMANPASRGAVVTPSLRLLAVLLVAISAGCSATPAATPPAPRAAEPPQWQAGDRWVYRINGSDKDTRTIEVDSTRLVSGQPYYYVIKASDTDLLNYWTLDLGW